MSDVTDELADGLAEIFGDAGDTVTYTPAGGEAAEISAVIGEANLIEAAAGDAEQDVEMLPITIRTDATAGIERPAKGDTVLIDSETWVVDAVVSRQRAGGVARLSLVRSAVVHKGTPGHRAPLPRM